MPIHDVECKKCKEVDEVLTLRIGEKIPNCPCGGKRIILVPSGKSPSFKLTYNPQKDMVDWDGNRSRYWDDYKKIPFDKRKNFRIPKHDGDEAK